MEEYRKVRMDESREASCRIAVQYFEGAATPSRRLFVPVIHPCTSPRMEIMNPRVKTAIAIDHRAW
jgi:hypothetical protein